MQGSYRYVKFHHQFDELSIFSIAQKLKIEKSKNIATKGTAKYLSEIIV
jgi:hypothetical protein